MTPYEFPQHDPGDEDARQRDKDQGVRYMLGIKTYMQALASVWNLNQRLAERRRINRNFNSRTNSWRG